MKNLLCLVFALLFIFGCGNNSSQSTKRAKGSDEKSEASKSMYGRYLYEDSRFELIMILNKEELSFTEKSATRKRGFKAKYHIENGNIIVLDKMMGDGPKKFLNKWNECGIKIDESGIEFWEDFSRDDKRMLFKKTKSQKEISENPKKSSKPYKDEKIEIDTKSTESRYSKYFDDISEGDKLLCFFSPSCEHCMETGKQITALKNKYPGLIPEVRILFMDESDNGSVKEINAFFEFIGAKYKYKVLSIEDFGPTFWNNHDFPGVLYLYEGAERIFFDGTGDKEFDGNKLLNEIKREY